MVTVIGILAALLFPVLIQAKASARRAACLSHLRQIGMGFQLYLADYDERLPDRRDLKTTLGYRPWTSWPPSDPRGGWALPLLAPYGCSAEIFQCPAGARRKPEAAPEAWQETPWGAADVWFWRFDRIDDPVPLDNFWGKTPSECVADLREAANPQAGVPEGEADVELAVDPYFPRPIGTVREPLRGWTPHAGGRNRLFLDTHARWVRDPRTS